MIAKALNQLKQFKFKEFGLSFNQCLLCNWRLQVKLYNNEMGIRCTKCGSSAVTQSLGKTFKTMLNSGQKLNVYELSSRGAFARFLQSTHHDITLSEYIDGVDAGEYQDGVICQDVQSLTFADKCFDLCTSLEVFEHVEDDIKGFKEVYRVLKSGGQILFTVPINLDANTIERTQVVDGKRVKVLPAEHHSDRLRGMGKVFCYRNYGPDIINRLEEAGFINCKIIKPNPKVLFGYGRAVIFGQKPKQSK